MNTRLYRYIKEIEELYFLALQLVYVILILTT